MQMQKNWAFGFLGLFGFLSIPEILFRGWFGSLWILWFIWFIYFIPLKKK